MILAPTLPTPRSLTNQNQRREKAWRREPTDAQLIWFKVANSLVGSVVVE